MCCMKRLILFCCLLCTAEQGLPEDALVAQKPATTALKHSLICILIKILHLCNFYMKALHNPHNIIIIARSTRVWYAYYGDCSETLQHFQM